MALDLPERWNKEDKIVPLDMGLPPMGNSTGWQCPNCNTCYAPFVHKCSECKPQYYHKITNTTSIEGGE